MNIEHSTVVGDSIWDLLTARRARALGVGLLSGGYSHDELQAAGTCSWHASCHQEQRRSASRHAEKERTRTMCLDCGCGKPNDKHGDDRHITMDDLRAAAQASEIPVDEAARNIADGVKKAQSGTGAD